MDWPKTITRRDEKHLSFWDQLILEVCLVGRYCWWPSAVVCHQVRDPYMYSAGTWNMEYHCLRPSSKIFDTYKSNTNLGDPYQCLLYPLWPEVCQKKAKITFIYEVIDTRCASQLESYSLIPLASKLVHQKQKLATYIMLLFQHYYITLLTSFFIYWNLYSLSYTQTT